jgi:hypothetical protein
VLCDQIDKGLRESEVVATVTDFSGRRHFLRVERDFLTPGASGRYYLPVALVHIDPRTKAALIEFPHEAETGANRVWVKPSALLEPLEASA